MRVISIVLFIATLILCVYGFRSQHVTTQSRALHTYGEQRGPTHEGSGSGAFHPAQEQSLRIILTIVLVPFCMILVFMKSQDSAAKGFSFTSLGIIIAYWLHSAT